LRTPDRDTAWLFVRYYVQLSVLFLLVYGGTNYFTSTRSDLNPLYFDWERHTVFVPGFVYVYLSIFLVFLLPLFFLGKPQIRALAATFTLATLIAGVIYLLLPAELPFVRPDTVPGHGFVFRWLYKLALPHNLFPSLHVTYAALFIGTAINVETSTPLRTALFAWLLLLLVSVILVRQHTIIDIAGGLALAAASYGAVYRRIAG
jgi:membrane-associated phospholipid phosphatase